MDIRIVDQDDENLHIVIHCREIDNEVMRLKAHIELFDRKLRAKSDNEHYFVNLSEVLYFESVEGRTFLYTRDDVMEIDRRLYELEDILSDKDFIRISKSLIVNSNKIRSLKPELNRTILVTMSNGECLCISRKYVKAVKNLLSI